MCDSKYQLWKRSLPYFFVKGLKNVFRIWRFTFPLHDNTEFEILLTLHSDTSGGCELRKELVLFLI